MVPYWWTSTHWSLNYSCHYSLVSRIPAWETKCPSLVSWVRLFIMLEEQTTSTVTGKKVITKIRAEINRTETRKIVEKISESKSWFLEKKSKIDKPFAWITKEKRKKTQIKSDIEEHYDRYHRNTKDHKKLLCRIMHQWLHYQHLGEVNKFLEIYNLPKLYKKETEIWKER